MLSEPPVDREVEAVAAGLRPSLELNEHHALALSDDLMNTRELRAEIRDFAYIQALRRLPPGDPARRPAIVSAGAVLVCPRRRCLLVHRRSSHSATYPGVCISWAARTSHPCSSRPSTTPATAAISNSP